jgi:hypothetical protein
VPVVLAINRWLINAIASNFWPRPGQNKIQLIVQVFDNHKKSRLARPFFSAPPLGLPNRPSAALSARHFWQMVKDRPGFLAENAYF